MASFCQEHLQPHFDSPAFRDHQLQPPVQDLMRRKCPQHNRLRDFFCPQHDECICHICLVEHKACSPASLSQASADLETKLKHKLTIIYSQINGASRALEDVRARQRDVRVSSRKTEQLRQEYMEIKALIDAAEATSTRKIKEEEKRVNTNPEVPPPPTHLSACSPSHMLSFLPQGLCTCPSQCPEGLDSTILTSSLLSPFRDQLKHCISQQTSCHHHSHSSDWVPGSLSSLGSLCTSVILFFPH
uniref:Tripartite motif containing 25 n=1 Tax=Ursus maritimus TaxID=29073 RepID=A0A452SZL5_URSMA